MITDQFRRLKSSVTVRNASSMLFGQITSKASFLGAMMLYSRLLSDSDLGSLMLVVAISQVLIFLSDMGVSIVLSRKLILSGRTAEALIGPAFMGRGFLWLVSSLLLLELFRAIGYSQSLLSIMAILFISAGLEAFCEQCYALFRARERMSWEGRSRVAGAVAGLGFAAACYVMKEGVLVASLSFPVRYGVSLLVALAGQRSLKPQIHLQSGWPAVSKTIVLESFSMGLIGLLFIAQQRIDSVFIKASLGTSAVGAFQQCYRIAESLVFLVSPTLLPGAFFPRLCRAFALGRASAIRVFLKLAFLFLVIALFTALPVAIAGEGLLELVWGSNYLRGLEPGQMGALLSLTMLTVPFFYMMHLTLTSLMAVGRQSSAVIPVLVAIILTAAGYHFLIPGLGLNAVPIVIILVNLMLSVLFGLTLFRTAGRETDTACNIP